MDPVRHLSGAIIAIISTPDHSSDWRRATLNTVNPLPDPFHYRTSGTDLSELHGPFHLVLLRQQSYFLFSINWIPINMPPSRPSAHNSDPVLSLYVFRFPFRFFSVADDKWYFLRRDEVFFFFTSRSGWPGKTFYRASSAAAVRVRDTARTRAVLATRDPDDKRLTRNLRIRVRRQREEIKIGSA